MDKDGALLPDEFEIYVRSLESADKWNGPYVDTAHNEVRSALGIKNTINGRGTVRDALKERYSALEEGKADILGLYMVRQLRERNELSGGRMEDNYVAFLASIFRSVRFGSGDAHGRANIAALNFLLLHLAPGDAADIIAAQSGGASAEFVAELRRSFGLLPGTEVVAEARNGGYDLGCWVVR